MTVTAFAMATRLAGHTCRIHNAFYILSSWRHYKLVKVKSMLLLLLFILTLSCAPALLRLLLPSFLPSFLPRFIWLCIFISLYGFGCCLSAVICGSLCRTVGNWPWKLLSQMHRLRYKLYIMADIYSHYIHKHNCIYSQSSSGFSSAIKSQKKRERERASESECYPLTDHNDLTAQMVLGRINPGWEIVMEAQLARGRNTWLMYLMYNKHIYWIEDNSNKKKAEQRYKRGGESWEARGEVCTDKQQHIH